MAICIVYACPVGALADQIEAYFARCLQVIGPNSAHRYMPHCSVTGFFQQENASLPELQELIASRLRQHAIGRVEVEARCDQAGFIHLPVHAPDLAAWSEEFVTLANAGARAEAIRAKRTPHVSLAYEYPAAQHDALVALADEMVDHRCPCDWELRLYERDPEWQWYCHASWPLLAASCPEC